MNPEVGSRGGDASVDDIGAVLTGAATAGRQAPAPDVRILKVSDFAHEGAHSFLCDGESGCNTHHIKRFRVPFGAHFTQSSRAPWDARHWYYLWGGGSQAFFLRRL